MWGLRGVVGLLCGVVAGLVCGVSHGLMIEDFQHELQWAPLFLHKPYLSFLNAFDRPTWRTRNPVSKREEARRHLKLPHGVPLGLACGACYQRSSTNTNLTVQVSGHEHQYHVRTHGPMHRHEYTVANHNECSVTTVLTAPITRSGTLTCTLQRGRQTTTETITFQPVRVEVEEPPVQVENSRAPSITLSCPEPPGTGPLVHVWHEEPQTDATLGHLPPTLTPSLHLSCTSQDRTLTCSVYNILNPSKVARATYRVLATGSSHQCHGSPLTAGQEGDQAVITRLSTTVQIIIVTTVLVIVLGLAVAIHHFVVAVKVK